ncbi:hypothetical protein V8E54_010983 [Elaphomyces granulatus]
MEDRPNDGSRSQSWLRLRLLSKDQRRQQFWLILFDVYQTTLFDVYHTTLDIIPLAPVQHLLLAQYVWKIPDTRHDTSELTPEFQNPAALSTVTVSSGTSPTTPTTTNTCTTGSAKGCQRLPVAIVDIIDVAFWDFANALVQKIYQSPNAQGKLTCSIPDPPKFPAQFPTVLSGNNGQSITATDLLYQMRQIVCSQPCNQGPAGIPSGSVQVISDTNNQECAIVAALAGGFQAIVYRATPFTGTQQQQCWDSTEFSINCTTNPNHLGWVNGPAEYQFYQAGFQSLNAKPPGDLSLHTPFAASQALARSTPPMPSATSGNHDGFFYCAPFRQVAPSAISQYVDSYIYTNYTSYYYSEGFRTGITAIFQCKDDASYAIGMLGSQIKTAIGWIKSIYKGKACGSVYLSNSCSVTVNYCGRCRRHWPPGQTHSP